MYKIEHLIDCVNRSDVNGFLMVYLELIIQKTSLSLPNSMDPKGCKQQWMDCIPKKCQGVTDYFLNELVSQWLSLLESHGGVETDNFAKELLTVFKHRKRNQNTTSATPQSAQSSSQVESSISSDYANDYVIRKQKLIELSKISAQLNKAFQMDFVSLFLSVYLQGAIQSSKYKVPQVSDLNQIQQQWTNILKKLLPNKYKQSFVDNLSKTWFHLLNTKYIPVSKEQLKEIYYYYASKNKKNINQEMSMPVTGQKNFFQKLFNAK